MKIIFFLLLFSLFFSINTPVLSAQGFAKDVNIEIKQDKGLGIEAFVGGDSKNQGGLIGTIFANVITLFFTVGAIGFTIMIIWGGVDWILSGGDKEKVANARKRITQAIVGLVVLSLSFVIMLVAGQILSIDALQYGKFVIPGLGDPIK